MTISTNKIITCAKSNSCSVLNKDALLQGGNVVIFICKCDNQCQKRKDAFIQTPWCKKCGNKNKSMSKSKVFGITEVIKKTESYGCRLLSKKYKNHNSILKFQCQCGNHFKKKWCLFVNKPRCHDCGSRKFNNSTKKPIDEILQEIDRSNCQWIEGEYYNAHSVLKFKCRCGNIFSKKWQNFKQIPQCRECGNRQCAQKKLTFD